MIASKLFTLLVGIEHVYILILEMFLWGNKRTNKIFGVKAEEANLKTVKTLAANQGLYNGFLAAGCFWGLIHSEEEFGKQISLFFTCCVFVAAIYGGLTANKKIFFTQGIPALLALVSLYIGI